MPRVTRRRERRGTQHDRPPAVPRDLHPL